MCAKMGNENSVDSYSVDSVQPVGEMLVLQTDGGLVERFLGSSENALFAAIAVTYMLGADRMLYKKKSDEFCIANLHYSDGKDFITSITFGPHNKLLLKL